MSHLLEATDLCKHYGDQEALRHVSLQVDEGSIYGLLGPNGAGKTTLIRIINGIIEADSGSVFVDGHPLTADLIRSTLGYLPEERGLYRKLRVGEQAIYMGRLRGLSRDDVRRELARWLHRWHMEDWLDKRVDQLSKGMAQKVQFIIALLHRPRLMILDEPFSGFDPVNAQLVRDAIAELNAQGTTFILSTHDMTQVEQMCDRIALINKAEIVLQGGVDAIRRQHAQGRYRLTCATPVVLWPEGVTVVEKTDAPQGETVYTVMLNAATTPNQLLAGLLTQTEVRSLEPQLPSMQEIFVRTVEGMPS